MSQNMFVNALNLQLPWTQLCIRHVFMLRKCIFHSLHIVIIRFYCCMLMYLADNFIHRLAKRTHLRTFHFDSHYKQRGRTVLQYFSAFNVYLIVSTISELSLVSPLPCVPA